uniref:Uncharacterized protein n=1 Tax=Meloidogyne enterolobii TaxID=390850 RepID=A0A6V7YC98_MELEN|nr:unnamed protein product [Meloidogyne enterolobii]
MQCFKELGFRQRNHSTATARHRRMLNSHAASQEDLDAGIGSFDYNELIDAQHLQQQMRAAAIATSVHGSGSENYSIHSLEQMPSTYFPIDHPCTIPADGQPHKVGRNFKIFFLKFLGKDQTAIYHNLNVKRYKEQKYIYLQ